MYTFECSICEKAIEEEFRARPRSSQCYSCYRELKRAYWLNNKWRQKRRDYYYKNQRRARNYSLRWYKQNKTRVEVRYLRHRTGAIQRNILHSLTLEQFEQLFQVTSCPVCGVNFDDSSRKTQAQIDRLIPALGYVVGNCNLLCGRCNALKSNASLTELRVLLVWLYSEIQKRSGSEPPQSLEALDATE